MKKESIKDNSLKFFTFLGSRFIEANLPAGQKIIIKKKQIV